MTRGTRTERSGQATRASNVLKHSQLSSAEDSGVDDTFSRTRSDYFDKNADAADDDGREDIDVARDTPSSQDTRRATRASGSSAKETTSQTLMAARAPGTGAGPVFKQSETSRARPLPRASLESYDGPAMRTRSAVNVPAAHESTPGMTGGGRKRRLDEASVTSQGPSSPLLSTPQLRPVKKSRMRDSSGAKSNVKKNLGGTEAVEAQGSQQYERHHTQRDGKDEPAASRKSPRVTRKTVPATDRKLRSSKLATQPVKVSTDPTDQVPRSDKTNLPETAGARETEDSLSGILRGQLWHERCRNGMDQHDTASVNKASSPPDSALLSPHPTIMSIESKKAEMADAQSSDHNSADIAATKLERASTLELSAPDVEGHDRKSFEDGLSAVTLTSNCTAPSVKERRLRSSTTSQHDHPDITAQRVESQTLSRPLSIFNERNGNHDTNRRRGLRISDSAKPEDPHGDNRTQQVAITTNVEASLEDSIAETNHERGKRIKNLGERSPASTALDNRAVAIQRTRNPSLCSPTAHGRCSDEKTAGEPNALAEGHSRPKVSRVQDPPLVQPELRRSRRIQKQQDQISSLDKSRPRKRRRSSTSDEDPDCSPTRPSRAMAGSPPRKRSKKPEAVSMVTGPVLFSTTSLAGKKRISQEQQQQPPNESRYLFRKRVRGEQATESGGVVVPPATRITRSTVPASNQNQGKIRVATRALDGQSRATGTKGHGRPPRLSSMQTRSSSNEHPTPQETFGQGEKRRVEGGGMEDDPATTRKGSLSMQKGETFPSRHTVVRPSRYRIPTSGTGGVVRFKERTMAEDDSETPRTRRAKARSARASTRACSVKRTADQLVSPVQRSAPVRRVKKISSSAVASTSKRTSSQRDTSGGETPAGSPRHSKRAKASHVPKLVQLGDAVDSAETLPNEPGGTLTAAIHRARTPPADEDEDIRFNSRETRIVDRSKRLSGMKEFPTGLTEPDTALSTTPDPPTTLEDGRNGQSADYKPSDLEARISAMIPWTSDGDTTDQLETAPVRPIASDVKYHDDLDVSTPCDDFANGTVLEGMADTEYMTRHSLWPKRTIGPSTSTNRKEALADRTVATSTNRLGRGSPGRRERCQSVPQQDHGQSPPARVGHKRPRRGETDEEVVRRPLKLRRVPGDQRHDVENDPASVPTSVRLGSDGRIHTKALKPRSGGTRTLGTDQEPLIFPNKVRSRNPGPEKAVSDKALSQKATVEDGSDLEKASDGDVNALLVDRERQSLEKERLERLERATSQSRTSHETVTHKANAGGISPTTANEQPLVIPADVDKKLKEARQKQMEAESAIRDAQLQAKEGVDHSWTTKVAAEEAGPAAVEFEPKGLQEAVPHDRRQDVLGQPETRAKRVRFRDATIEEAVGLDKVKPRRLNDTEAQTTNTEQVTREDVATEDITFGEAKPEQAGRRAAVIEASVSSEGIAQEFESRKRATPTESVQPTAGSTTTTFPDDRFVPQDTTTDYDVVPVIVHHATSKLQTPQYETRKPKVYRVWDGDANSSRRSPKSKCSAQERSAYAGRENDSSPPPISQRESAEAGSESEPCPSNEAQKSMGHMSKNISATPSTSCGRSAPEVWAAAVGVVDKIPFRTFSDRSPLTQVVVNKGCAVWRLLSGSQARKAARKTSGISHEGVLSETMESTMKLTSFPRKFRARDLSILRVAESRCGRNRLIMANMTVQGRTALLCGTLSTIRRLVGPSSELQARLHRWYQAHGATVR